MTCHPREAHSPRRKGSGASPSSATRRSSSGSGVFRVALASCLVGPLPAALLLVLLTPGQAAAYIDPISGSIILQVLAAAALGALLTVKRVWMKVTGVWSRVWEAIRRPWRP